jgi:drug/metabolite transporter (DMT)-like permease
MRALETAPEWRHYAVLLCAQMAIGSAAILARVGLDEGMSPAALAAWRLTLAAALLWIVLGRRLARLPSVTSRDAALLFGAGALVAVHFVAWFGSLERISVARSTLLVCTSPVFAGLIGATVLRQHVANRFWLGLLVAGVGLVGITSTAAVAGASLAGDALAVGGALAMALYLLVAGAVQRRTGTVLLIAAVNSSAALVLWPVALAASGPTIPISEAAWAAVIGMAVVPQLVGHSALSWSLLRFIAGAVGAATLLEPVIASLLAWWLFDEALSPFQAFSGAVVLLGVGLATTARVTERGARWEASV